MTDVAEQQAVRVDAAKLEEFVTNIFRDAGCDTEDARVLAWALVAADMRGTHTHGTQFVPVYAKLMKDGTINPRAKARIVKETAAVTLWDGDGGIGHITGYRVVQDAIARTKQNELGITFAIATNSSHLGAVGLFALLAAEQDLVALSMSTTPPVVVVPGGAGRAVGNSPLSWATPATDNLGPMCFDGAWSVSANSRFAQYARRGEQLPEGWAVDADGQPSRDPNVFVQGGALMPAGGHKGYGMILLIEILSAVLGGGSLMSELEGWDGGWCHAFIVIDPTVFQSLDDFKDRLGTLVQVLHDSPTAVDNDRILVPGERALEHVAESEANGLAVHDEIWAALVKAAEEWSRVEELEATRQREQ
jgi:LDH2 family malate/lactate/ureidoglycolate dehydrogenase